MFFFRVVFSHVRGGRPKGWNCGLFGKNRSRSQRERRTGIFLRTPAAVDKFFVFVGKSPQNKAFAGTLINGLQVFPDQNEKAYSFVVKPA
ncbi:hypothetical protein [Rhizobium sp.]|uniref:hypothetical protein n=1 Tax=Rhizobium sp. TaxID=391 RepID=UPI0028AE49C1